MVDQPREPVDPGRRVSDEAERARAVAEFLRDQESRAEQSRDHQARRHRVTRFRRGALISTWAAVAYVWLFAPPSLAVERPAPQSVTEEARALRMNIFFQSQKIEAYMEARGRLPYVLEEAGPPFRDIEYHRTDSRFYELRGESERVHLRYQSIRPALDFLGRAAERLEEAFGSGGRSAP